MHLVLFNLSIGPYQVLRFQARVDLEAMTMKGCSAFPKTLILTNRLFSVISRTLIGGGGGSYPSADLQSVYSTALGKNPRVH